MKTSLLPALAAALALAPTLAGTASAREPRPALPEFAQMDMNADGMVTPEEMQRFRLAGLNAADTNRDGYLDRAEVESVVRAQLESARPEAAGRLTQRLTDRIFARGDSDGDGLISQDEIARRLAMRGFRVADADGDGVITREEAAAPRMPRDRSQRLRNQTAPAPVETPAPDR
ncbi:MAG TPA: EF-hand domain-containing protein [Paracoccaceae bacterium]|nr:EF-hand domain-containing protein [Paracoccaceae bacterium]